AWDAGQGRSFGPLQPSAREGSGRAFALGKGFSCAPVTHATRVPRRCETTGGWTNRRFTKRATMLAELGQTYAMRRSLADYPPGDSLAARVGTACQGARVPLAIRRFKLDCITHGQSRVLPLSPTTALAAWLPPCCFRHAPPTSACACLMTFETNSNIT